MTGTGIPHTDKPSWNADEPAQVTTLEPPRSTTPVEPATLTVPEHLHQLWLALGLDDE